MYLEDRELAYIIGGNVSATLLNALARGVKTIYDIGYSLGQSIGKLFKWSC